LDIEESVFEEPVLAEEETHPLEEELPVVFASEDPEFPDGCRFFDENDFYKWAHEANMRKPIYSDVVVFSGGFSSAPTLERFVIGLALSRMHTGATAYLPERLGVIAPLAQFGFKETGNLAPVGFVAYLKVR